MTPKSVTELHSFFFVSPSSQEKANGEHNLTHTPGDSLTWLLLKSFRKNKKDDCLMLPRYVGVISKVSWLNRDRNRDYFLRPGNIPFHCFTICFFDRALSIFWAGSKSGLKLIRGRAWNKNLEFFLKDFYSQTEFLEHLRIFRRLCLDDSKLLFFHSICYMKLENHHHVDRWGFPWGWKCKWQRY